MREERGELAKIAQHDLETAVDEFLPVTQGQGSQELARSAGADGGVVFEGDDFVQEFRVVTGEPAKAQTGKAIGFANGAQADGTIVEITARGQARRLIMLQLAV